MVNPSVITALPGPMRQALDQRLRAANYGGHAPAQRWLLTQGQTVGRSSVGRYAMALRRADAAAGNPPPLPPSRHAPPVGQPTATTSPAATTC